MLQINAHRLLQNLAELAQIGATADHAGVSRLAFSAEDVAGRMWFKGQVEAAGLAYAQDGAGNQSAVWRCANPAAPTLLIGSHLDTVPNGGRYDGALGVLAALEVVRTIREAGLALPVHLEAINFTDEEGTILGEFGSLALTGQLTSDKLSTPRGGREALIRGMNMLGIDFLSTKEARRKPASLAGFVELHIEQGSRLEQAGTAVGVVTGIVGIRSFWLTFVGEAAHAGTRPLDDRRDALWGTADFIQQARHMVRDRFHPGVINFGQISAAPGAFNIVPAEVQLALEFRHGTEGQLNEMEVYLLSLAEQVARSHNLTVRIDPVSSCTAAPSDEQVVQAIEQAAEQLGLSHQRLMSFAGHDTQTLSAITPSAMIFVPCVAGISHNPRELCLEQDCVNGANVLLHTVLRLTNGRF